MGNIIFLFILSRMIKYNENNFIPVKMSYKLWLPLIISTLIWKSLNRFFKLKFKVDSYFYNFVWKKLIWKQSIEKFIGLYAQRSYTKPLRNVVHNLSGIIHVCEVKYIGNFIMANEIHHIRIYCINWHHKFIWFEMKSYSRI